MKRAYLGELYSELDYWLEPEEGGHLNKLEVSQEKPLLDLSTQKTDPDAS